MSSETVTGLPSGLRAIQARDYLLTERYQEQQWRADRRAADRRILEFEHAFILRCEKLGIPMFAHCIVRSLAEQTQRYVEGHSKAKAGRSPHNFGLAVDLIHGVNAWDLPRESWLCLGHLGKEIATQNGIAVTWGGDFQSLWDPAHWEIKNWKELAGL